MKLDDFRMMRRGIPLFELKKQDIQLLKPIEQRSKKRKHALLLFHGFTSTPAVFRAMLPLFSFYDAIFCPILPGHVSSLEVFSKVKAGDWLALAEEQGKTLSCEFEKLDVLGLSLGGLLGAHLSNVIKLNHLYLLAPAFELYSSLNCLIPLAKALKWLGFKELRSHPGDLYTEDYCEIAYRKMPLATIVELLTFIQQAPSPSTDCPTDLFLGEHDQVVSSKSVADRFNGQDNINIHWLAHSAHVIPLDGDIKQIVAYMKKQRNL